MPRRYKVVITDFINDALEPELAALREIADVEALCAGDESEFTDRLGGADALMVYHNVTLRAETIANLNSCKIIVRCGVGTDNIDLAAARERGIDVANIPDYGTEEVADSAIGMMLSLVRGIALYNSRLRDGRGPWGYTQAAPLRRLRGRTFGIVGLGRIGTATAIRAKALGMQVGYYDPYKELGYDKALGLVRSEKLEDLLRNSYVLSIHCPLTPETYHMIDQIAIDALQNGTYLVNTARGCVVDTAFIPDAMASGKLAGAGIDVPEGDPPGPDDPLILAWRDPSHPAHDRVIINPHAAFYCEEALEEIRVKAAATCRKALLGEPLLNVVN
jgi:D-3-phosphoglycerate dehydrogenase/C-terminal binding protein